MTAADRADTCGRARSGAAGPPVRAATDERAGGADERGGGTDERGGGTMIMIGVLAVVMSVAWGATVIAGYLVAGHRASSIADLAAVSAAAAYVSGAEPCATARRMAVRQRATVTCELVGDQIDFVVTVTATVQVPAPLPALPTRVSAVGHAGPTTTAQSVRKR